MKGWRTTERAAYSKGQQVKVEGMRPAGWRKSSGLLQAEVCVADGWGCPSRRAELWAGCALSGSQSGTRHRGRGEKKCASIKGARQFVGAALFLLGVSKSLGGSEAKHRGLVLSVETAKRLADWTFPDVRFEPDCDLFAQRSVQRCMQLLKCPSLPQC